MLDRWIFRTLSLMVVTMISVLAAAALVMMYFGLMDLFVSHFSRGSILLIGAPMAVWVSFLLIRYREDLTGDVGIQLASSKR
jgi:hypothetical protein